MKISRLRYFADYVVLFAVLVLSGLSVGSAPIDPQDQNPASVWCDYHSTYFFKAGVEYPSGVCYDVYKHTFYDPECRCTRTHKMVMRCPKPRQSSH